MTDWIDDLRNQEALKREAGDTQEKIRLHNAKMIAAKLPMFWQATIDCLDRDTKKLRETFPTIKERHCHIEATSNMVAIVNEGRLPRLDLRLQLNVSGQCVDVFYAVKRDMFRKPEDLDSRRIDVTIDQHEQLEFRYEGKVHRTPESLAQAFVSHACKI
jgi:hypothetical protein